MKITNMAKIRKYIDNPSLLSFTQETEEPLQFSLAEPLDCLGVSENLGKNISLGIRKTQGS